MSSAGVNGNAADKRKLQAANWGGSIPVLLTLAPTSLSSPTLPPPIHVLVPRQTFLHTGLRDAVTRLHKFAPTTLSFVSGMIRKEPGPGSYDDHHDKDGGDGSSDGEAKKTAIHARSSDNSIGSSPPSGQSSTASYPACWFEDESTQLPLRWQLFAGVLYDMKSDRQLPWRIRLHFTAYPSSQILPLEEKLVLTQVQRFYKNSLKQALCLEYGNSKVAMNLTKDSHSTLWDAVVTGHYPSYGQVTAELPSLPDNAKNISKDKASHLSSQLIPVRLFLDAKPPVQRACRRFQQDPGNDSAKEAASDGGCVLRERTLGVLLSEWLPELFIESAASSSRSVGPSDEVSSWRIGGVQPSLETTVFDLWQSLCHPDHFLYIVVSTGNK